jgi:hypothetical protein
LITGHGQLHRKIEGGQVILFEMFSGEIAHSSSRSLLPIAIMRSAKLRGAAFT